jgi:DNA mismatch repair protein MutS2
MDQKTLNVLEWPQVVELLAQQATNNMGRDRCHETPIHTKLDEVSAALRLTTECKDLLRVAGGMPLGGILDIRPAIKRADQGVTLNGEELLAIASTVRAGKVVKDFLSERQEAFPALYELAEPIATLGDLGHAIISTFDASGEVADSASAELGKIRNRIRESQSRVRQSLQRIISSNGNALQDPIITMRGDRYVLPVRADAHGAIPGIVHDQSASGATLYVEPIAVVEANNQLRQAMLAEKAEVERILAALTDKVRAHVEPLRWNCEALADIDCTHAKARLSQMLDGSAPRLNREGKTRLFKARHPLLAYSLGKDVVPTDIAVGDPETVLLITGPNTGGKTVSLKTLGLATLMTQAGMHPPVEPGSQIGIVASIFADIGDEQSLAQSLSTFSGHMTNIIRILGAADHRTLVLLDELGAGTDPHEGAALARAIIEEFLKRGTRLVATTHYGELKMLHYQVPGIQNAAVEFDLETLSPTYRLIMGVSGQSNAVAIAERLGLTLDLVGRARELLENKATDTAEVMDKVIADRHHAAELLHRAEKASARAETMKREYEAKLEKWQAERRELEAKAKEKVEQQVRSAQGEIAAIIRELQASKNAPAAQKARDRLQKYDRYAAKTNAPKAGPAPKTEELTIGKTVFLPKLGQNGKVMTLPDNDGNMRVQVGSLTVTVNRRDVTLKSGAVLVDKEPPRKRTGTIVLASAPTGLSCDLRGMLGHEAVAEADKYLDQAFGAQMKSVTLVHGAGSGALRNAIRDFLKDHPCVKSYRQGGPTEGGDGVTVVEFV